VLSEETRAKLQQLEEKQKARRAFGVGLFLAGGIIGLAVHPYTAAAVFCVAAMVGGIVLVLRN
jgi:hypothetical protein